MTHFLETQKSCFLINVSSFKDVWILYCKTRQKYRTRYTFLVIHKTFNAIMNLRLPKTSSLMGLNYANAKDAGTDI